MLKLTNATRSKARTSAALGLGLGALLLGATSAQARPAAPAQVTAKCRASVVGAPWSIRAAGHSISGTRYNVVANGVSCAFAFKYIPALTRVANNGKAPRGPGKYRCLSFSQTASGDKLLYAGVCKIDPGEPFFAWGPQTHK